MCTSSLQIGAYVCMIVAILIMPNIAKGEFKFFQDYANTFSSTQETQYEKILRDIHTLKNVVIVVTIFSDRTTAQIKEEIPTYFEKVQKSIARRKGYAIIVYDVKSKRVQGIFSPEIKDDIGEDYINQFLKGANDSIKSENHEVMIDELMQMLTNHYFSATQFQAGYKKAKPVGEQAAAAADMMNNTIKWIFTFGILIVAGRFIWRRLSPKRNSNDKPNR